MSRLRNVVITDQGDDGRVHLPNDYGATAGMQTLCGWVDVNAELTDEPANCPTCVKVMEHARKVWLARKRLIGGDA